MRINPKTALYAFEILLGVVIAGWWLLGHRSNQATVEKPAAVGVHDPELGPQLSLPTPAAALPTLPETQQEMHGTFLGQPFWSRLLTADANGRRELQLVYTPPAHELLDGAILVDCPFLQLDRHAGILAWNGRGHLSEISRDKEDKTYKVIREVQVGEGDAAKSTAKLRTLTIEPVWDLRLAPVLLALSWRPDSSGRIRLMDFFGPRIQDELYIEWSDRGVTLAGEAYSIVGNPGFERLEDTGGRVVLEIEGRQ